MTCVYRDATMRDQMTDYDPDECKRLIAQTREDDEVTRPAPWSAGDDPEDGEIWDRDMEIVINKVRPWPIANHTCSIARLRNNARPLADQLEAAVREVEQMRADDKIAAGECMVPVEEMTPGSHLRRVVKANRMWRYERGDLRAEVAKLTEELDAMRSVVEAAEQWRSAVCSCNGTSHHEWDCTLNDVMSVLKDAVDAYRVAKEKP